MKLKLLTAALLLVAVAGCNTVSGVGKDVSALGSAVTKGSENAKK